VRYNLRRFANQSYNLLLLLYVSCLPFDDGYFPAPAPDVF
jgi:hypothetical protein